MARKFGKLLVVLFACAPVFAATTGTISGVIKNSSGTPQMGAVVEIFTSAAALGTTVFTDANGFYNAENLTPGTYQVKVSAASFLPSLRENVTLRSGARLIINLTLNTMADALKLLPDRRSPNSDSDEWHWTLRSAANRPVLRIFDNGPLVVIENPEASDAHDLKGSVTFIAGSEADGFGSAGEMTTTFALEKSLFSSGTLTFNGDIGTTSGEPTGILRASYAHDFGNGSRPRLTVTYRHLASPGMAVQNAAYSAIGTTASDTMSIAGFIDLDYGAELQALQFARRVTAVRPFGRVDVHLSPDMVVEYRYATSEPDPRVDKGFATAPADLSESGPRMALTSGVPDLEKAHHQEISISRRFGNNNVQVAYYTDQIRNIVLTGAGDPSSYSDDVLPDVYSGTFSYAGGGLSTTGMRVVAQRKFSDDLTATVDYSTGGVIMLRTPVTTWQSVASTLGSDRQHAIGAKIAGRIPHCSTRLVASYKWNSGKALSAVDQFNASPGQMDPYLSLFIRQPLPGASFIPGKMEALIDVRNLLAQGYIPVLGMDGRTLYLVQSARAVRGGLAFTF
ncbi:MAG TPA: carboxypeptidase-like regulatory domain-containing protein [Candidatus Angelobacter sp.]|nr:carboxypeptidase-like regulatory domain-containing protein [Candidatus Angelobacter sp.]